MSSGVFERATNRFLPGALIASALIAACSGPSENDFFGGDPPGASGNGGSAASTSGSGNAGSETGGSTNNGGSAGTGGSASGTGGTAGSEASGGTAGSETGGTAGNQTAGTAGTEVAGTAGSTAGTAGEGSGGIAGTTGAEAGAGGVNEGGAAGAPVCVPEDERCDGLDNDCENGVDDGNACPDDCVGASYEGHDYLFCSSDNGGPLGGGRAWAQARTFCVAEDKVLVHLETESEAKFVYGKLVELDLGLDAWMGATDREEDEWMWEGTSMLDAVQFYDADTEMAIGGYFIDWREGEPNDDGSEDCGVIEDQGDGTYLWDDRSCMQEQELFVCEGEP